MSNVVRHSFCKNTLFFNNFQTFMRFFFLIRINYPFFLPFYLAKIYIQKTIHVYQRSDFHCPSEIPLLPNSRTFFSEKHWFIILFLYFML